MQWDLYPNDNRPTMRISHCQCSHDGDVIMGAIAFQITSLTTVYSTVYSDADQRKHQSSASLASVWGIHRGPVNSPHKCPVTRKMFPFDDVIMVGGGSHRTSPPHLTTTFLVCLLSNLQDHQRMPWSDPLARDNWGLSWVQLITFYSCVVV